MHCINYSRHHIAQPVRIVRVRERGTIGYCMGVRINTNEEGALTRAKIMEKAGIPIESQWNYEILFGFGEKTVAK